MGGLPRRRQRTGPGHPPMPGAHPHALGATGRGATGRGAPGGRGALVREMGRSVALLALSGLSVGGGLSMVVAAFHALGR